MCFNNDFFTLPGGRLRGLVGSVLDHRSLPSEFESRRGRIWRLFHLRSRFIAFGGRSAHLSYHVPNSCRKTSINHQPLQGLWRLSYWTPHISRQTGYLHIITRVRGGPISCYWLISSGQVNHFVSTQPSGVGSPPPHRFLYSGPPLSREVQQQTLHLGCIGYKSVQRTIPCQNNTKPNTYKLSN